MVTKAAAKRRAYMLRMGVKDAKLQELMNGLANKSEVMRAALKAYLMGPTNQDIWEELQKLRKEIAGTQGTLREEITRISAYLGAPEHEGLEQRRVVR